MSRKHLISHIINIQSQNVLMCSWRKRTSYFKSFGTKPCIRNIEIKIV